MHVRQHSRRSKLKVKYSGTREKPFQCHDCHYADVQLVLVVCAFHLSCNCFGPFHL